MSKQIDISDSLVISRKLLEGQMRGLKIFHIIDKDADIDALIDNYSTPLAPIIEKAWDEGHWEGKDFINDEISNSAKQKFLNSKIEIQ